MAPGGLNNLALEVTNLKSFGGKVTKGKVRGRTAKSVRTRWNYTYAMIHRAQLLREASLKLLLLLCN